MSLRPFAYRNAREQPETTNLRTTQSDHSSRVDIGPKCPKNETDEMSAKVEKDIKPQTINQNANHDETGRLS